MDITLGGQSAFELIDEGNIFVKKPHRTDAFIREREALNNLKDNSRIVEVLYVDDDNHYLHLKKAPGISLTDFIKYEMPLPGEVNSIIQEVAEVLMFMHSPERDYVHYDLSSDNIFWDRKEHEVTVIDFGTAYHLGDHPKEYLEDDIGTPVYMSPEKLNHEPNFGKEADMYALGVIWYELFSGSVPFSPNIGNLKRQILNDDPIPLKSVTDKTNHMIMSLLDKDPKKRPTAKELVEWFNTLEMP